MTATAPFHRMGLLLCILREPDLRELMRQRPELSTRMLEILSERLREMEELIESLALDDVESRLLHLLVHLAENFGVEDEAFHRVDIRLSHEDLAHMIASTRETVSMTLSRMRDQGAVKTARRQIWVNLEQAQALFDER